MVGRQSAVIIFVALATLNNAAKLPKFLNKCKLSDSNVNECILNTIRSGYDEFAKGDDSVHLQSLNPLKVPFMHINVDGSLIINLKDSVISGFETAQFKKGEFDMDKKMFHYQFQVPSKMNVQAEYDINGRILILPIQGKGPANITFIEPLIDYTVNFDIKEKGDKKYIEPKKNDFVYTMKRAHFQLDNLFNGDERLGNEMLKFLNENWKEVNDEIGVKVAEAIGEVLMQLLGNFFKKVPINELFEE